METALIKFNLSDSGPIIVHFLNESEPALYSDEAINMSMVIKKPLKDDLGRMALNLPGATVKVFCPELETHLPFVRDVWTSPQMLTDAIMHLNDFHRWTREQIADWLETLDIDLEFK